MGDFLFIAEYWILWSTVGTTRYGNFERKNGTILPLALQAC